MSVRQPFRYTSIPPETEFGHALFERLYAILEDIGALLQDIRDRLPPQGVAVPVQAPAAAPGTRQVEVQVVSPIPQTPPVPITSVAASEENIDAAVANPDVRRPLVAVRTSSFPVPITAVNDYYVAAGQGILTQTGVYVVPAPGLVIVDVSIDSATGTPSAPTISKDGGVTFAAFNQGADIPVGAEFAFASPVFAGDQVDFSSCGHSSCPASKGGQGWVSFRVRRVLSSPRDHRSSPSQTQAGR